MKRVSESLLGTLFPAQILFPDPSRLTVSMTLLINLTQVSTFSCVSAMTKQCNSSSSSAEKASGLPLPSLTLPFPLIEIFAPLSDSIFFNEFPRGPTNKPKKLISGNSSFGMYTFSCGRLFRLATWYSAGGRKFGSDLRALSIRRTRSSSSFLRYRISRVLVRRP
jgi:hypothetical protein